MPAYFDYLPAAGWGVLALLWGAILGDAHAQSAQSGKRVAFVVGIDRYDNLSHDKQLQKAVGDARAMHTTLSHLGYGVTVDQNVTRLGLLRRWQEFLNTIEPGDEAAVFFAGHGIEIAGVNYLIPGDVPQVGAGEEELLKGAAVQLDALLDSLRERRPRVSLVILDACRNNPFIVARGRSIGTAKGLADTRPPRGTFIMYSAAAGQQALDSFGDNDPDANSIYTRTLIPLLMTPRLDINDIARRVRRQVHELTQGIGHLQTPAYYDELIGHFCPAGCNDAVAGHELQQPAPAALASTALEASPEAPSANRRSQERAPTASFDGTWLISGRSANCPNKTWTRVWTIVGRDMFNAKNKKFGQIDGDGKFKFRLPSPLKPNLIGTFSGRFRGGSGEGSFAFPGCGGTFTIKRS